MSTFLRSKIQSENYAVMLTHVIYNAVNLAIEKSSFQNSFSEITLLLSVYDIL